MNYRNSNFILFRDILKKVEEDHPPVSYDQMCTDVGKRLAPYIVNHQASEMSELVTDILRSDSNLTRDMIGLLIHSLAMEG